MKYIIDEHQGENHDFTFWTPDYFRDLARFCFPEARIYALSEQDKFVAQPTFHTKVMLPTFLRQHLTDFNSLLLADIILPPEQKNYLKPDLSRHKLAKACRREMESVNGRYVVFTTMFTSKTRVFRAKEVNKLADWCVANGLTPVFAGKEHVDHFASLDVGIKGSSEEGVDYSKGVNLINKTSLIDLLKIMDGAAAVVGLDNGLCHLACMTDVYVVGAFTSVNPDHRLPYRKNIKGWNYDVVVPDESLGCRFCQSNWCYDVKQDFTKCFYQDYECTYQITAEKFIAHLEKKLL